MTKNVSPLLATLAVIYAAPVGVYIARFGPVVTTDHARWAEFGSAMAGIYAPIVALSTLAILIIQVRLQAQINDHQYDQSYLTQARSDIEFYAQRLAEALEKQIIPGQTVRQSLQLNFQLSSPKKLDDPNQRSLAANIHSNAPAAFDLWFALYPILAGLSATRRRGFEMTLTSSKQKLIAILSFDTCVALENFHRTRTGGKVGVRYQFSPLLSA